jgi:hypothetical protein
MPFITANPTRSPDEKRDAEAILDAAALYDLYNRLTGPDAAKTTEGFVGAMVTKAMPADGKKWIPTELQTAAASRRRSSL